MERTFSLVLAELRKEQGWSQKETASRLGVSQALLSHYERGIRECSHEFLVRASNCFGVSCDYLLGHTLVRGDAPAEEKSNDDSVLSSDTVTRAAAAIIEKLRGADDSDYDLIRAMAVYLLLICEVDAGRLPKSWACLNADGSSEIYRGFIVNALTKLSHKPSACVPTETEVPESVETLCREVTEYLKRTAAQELPFIG